MLLFDRVVDWQTKLNTTRKQEEKEQQAEEHTHTPEAGGKTADDGGSEEVEGRLEVSHYSAVHVRILQHS